MSDDTDVGLLQAVAEGSKLNQQVEVVANKRVNAPTVIEDADAAEDVKKAKSTIREVMELGSDALKDAAGLAKATEDPKVMAIIPSLMKEIVNASRTLTDMSTSKAGGSKGAEVPAGDGKIADHIENNTVVFNGSPTDLQKMLDERGSGDVIEGEWTDGSG